MTELKFIEVPATSLDRPPCDEDEQLRRSRQGGGNRDVWVCFRQSASSTVRFASGRSRPSGQTPPTSATALDLLALA